MKAVGLFLTIQGGAGQIEHKKMRDRRFPSRIFTFCVRKQIHSRLSGPDEILYHFKLLDINREGIRSFHFFSG